MILSEVDTPKLTTSISYATQSANLVSGLFDRAYRWGNTRPFPGGLDGQPIGQCTDNISAFREVDINSENKITDVDLNNALIIGA
jgi:hypothetical protein